MPQGQSHAGTAAQPSLQRPAESAPVLLPLNMAIVLGLMLLAIVVPAAYSVYRMSA